MQEQQSFPASKGARLFFNDQFHLWLLILLGLALFFPFLGARDFWAPVEPRYAEIARLMSLKGEWIVPAVNGELYTDKPILYFWLVLLGSKLIGAVNEWSVRLPSALAASGLVLTTYYLGRELISARVGFLGAIILATTARVLWEGRWAHTDMPFTFFFALSLYFLSRAIFITGNGKDFLLAYGLAGMATLTKGLIGVVLPGLIFFVFLILRGEWRRLKDWRLPSGLLVFCLIVGPWFAAVGWATGGRWVEDFVFIHHVQRYTGGLGHGEPFYYYFVNFPLDFLPWTVFLIPAFFAFKNRLDNLKQPVNLFLFLWFVSVFFFFTLSDSKRGLYLLPVFPPAALFTAAYLDNLMTGRMPQTRLFRWWVYLFFHLLWIGALSAPLIAWFYQRGAFWLSLPFAFLMVAGGLATIYFLRRASPSKVFASIALTVCLGIIYASGWIFPYIDALKSPRFFALRVKQIVPENQPLYIYADTMNDFNFYVEREAIPVLASRAELKRVLTQEQGAFLLIRGRDLKRLSLEREARNLAEAPVGGKKWHLLAFGLVSPRSSGLRLPPE